MKTVKLVRRVIRRKATGVTGSSRLPNGVVRLLLLVLPVLLSLFLPSVSQANGPRPGVARLAGR